MLQVARMHPDVGVRTEYGAALLGLWTTLGTCQGMLAEMVDDCDRWRIAELVQSLEAVGFPDCQLSDRRQGYKDGDEDVRLFRTALLDGKLHPQQSLLIRASVGGARVMTDPAGNSKLHKRGGATCRDDMACAIIMAVAEGRRRAPQTEPEPFSYAVL